jgi:hypothetical protein
MAQLVIQANGAYEGAVRVMVGGSELGSIPSRLAGKFRDAITQLDSVGCPATCHAQLEAELPEGNVDVFLWAAPSLRDHDEPFLPPGLGPPLRLYPGQAERLDASIDSRAKVKRVVKTGEIRPSDGGWCVVVDGVPIGNLRGDSDSRLREVSTAGFPLTCRVRIIRERERLRVLADLPRD